MNETDRDNEETDDKKKLTQATDDNGDTVRSRPKREAAQRTIKHIRQQINKSVLWGETPLLESVIVCNQSFIYRTTVFPKLFLSQSYMTSTSSTLLDVNN